MIYFYYFPIEALTRFEALKKSVLKKAKTDEVKTLIEELTQELNLTEEINSMHDAYKEHFFTFGIDWKMALDISKDVCEVELGNVGVGYPLDLTNYFLSYLSLNPAFKKLFFLQHGYILRDVSNDTLDEIKKRYYVIFKKDQELSTNYLLYGSEITDDLHASINNSLTYYGLPKIEQINDAYVCIVQFFD